MEHVWHVCREAELTCGTDSTPMDGTACVVSNADQPALCSLTVQDGPGTGEQHVCGMCGILYDMSFPIGATQWGLQ